MSETAFNKAKVKLVQEKGKLQRLLRVLSNPAAFLQQYELNPAERDRLLQEDIAGIQEMLLAYAEVATKHTEGQAISPTLIGRQSIEVSELLKTAGIDSSQSVSFRFQKVRKPGEIVHMELVGPDGPIYWPQNPPWPEPEPDIDIDVKKPRFPRGFEHHTGG